MTATRPGKLQQVLLLCALAVGVVAMHHVGMASAAGATTMHAMAAPGPQVLAAAPDSNPGEHDPGLHDVLHLCLAVLCAAGALLLAVALFLAVSWCTTTFSRTPDARGSPSRGRPPGRSVLISLCISRT
ncbi:DUF6153 family protein [Amycolatopsis sp. NPDC003861]